MLQVSGSIFLPGSEVFRQNLNEFRLSCLSSSMLVVNPLTSGLDLRSATSAPPGPVPSTGSGISRSSVSVDMSSLNGSGVRIQIALQKPCINRIRGVAR